MSTTQSKREVAQNVFNSLDKDGNGSLAEDELKRWLIFQCGMDGGELDELWLDRWGGKEEIEFEDFWEAAQEYDWPLKAGRQEPELAPKKDHQVSVLRLLVQGADFLPCNSQEIYFFRSSQSSQELGHDPYIRISYHEQHFRTKTSMMNSSPTWNEMFILEHLTGSSIKFQLFHESRSIEDTMVGETTLESEILDRIMLRGINTMEEHSLKFKDASGNVLTGKGGLESNLHCQVYVTNTKDFSDDFVSSEGQDVQTKTRSVHEPITFSLKDLEKNPIWKWHVQSSNARGRSELLETSVETSALEGSLAHGGPNRLFAFDTREESDPERILAKFGLFGDRLKAVKEWFTQLTLKLNGSHVPRKRLEVEIVELGLESQIVATWLGDLETDEPVDLRLFLSVLAREPSYAAGLADSLEKPRVRRRLAYLLCILTMSRSTKKC